VFENGFSNTPIALLHEKIFPPIKDELFVRLIKKIVSSRAAIAPDPTANIFANYYSQVGSG
jgi:hypothetical protein